MIRNLVEGYFVITTEDLVFEIKGVIHPRNRVIAYLRYVPTKGKTSSSEIDYKKVYALDERTEYLQDNYPTYLWFSEPHGRIVQSVPNDSIKSILNPVDSLANMRDCGSDLSDLGQASVELAKTLIDTTGIEWSDMGITGSQLVGVAKKDSDIDLVVYGSNPCRKFYSNLSKNIASIGGVERYSGKLLDEHVSFRWGAHENLRNILRKIERAKLLQGVYKGHHFFVRLVKSSEDLDYVYGDVSFQMKGQQLVSGRIVNDDESMFTPCEYLIDCDDFPTLRKLVSYRGRFTEQILKGSTFEALGRLEMVTDHKDAVQYLQLILGELTTDYLIPK
ncbi:MAG: nucleotidyltransferase domain-containing protein [Candidatus Thorarchaeota archaeon]